MSYVFFFSYSRDDYSPYMEKFLGELKEEVRIRLGLGQEDSIYFRDAEDIDVGKPWKAELLDALQTSKVLICVYTPRYFVREYCGKEVQFFIERQHALGNTNPQNAFIIPVIWQPCETSIPPGVAEIGYLHNDFPPEYRLKGFRPFVQNSSQFSTQYFNSLHAVADRIAAAAKQAVQLPRLGQVPSLADLPNAFEQPDNAPGIAAVQEPHAGPTAVQFYYVAGKRTELLGQKGNCDYYDSKGGEFWRPCLRGRFLGTMATSIATSKELDLLPYNLPIATDFRERLQMARDNNNIVILFVDTWTIHLLPWYRQRMSEYEQHNSYHCSVLVVWNEDDPETDQARQVLSNRVSVTFPVNASREQTYFRPSITNMTELETSLRETLERLRHKIIEQAEVARALDGSAKPTLDIHIERTR